MPEFCIPVRVTGKVELTIEAKTPEEAQELANDKVSEMDFGELEDIEWEPKDPI